MNKIFKFTLFVLLVVLSAHNFDSRPDYEQLADVTPLMLQRAKNLRVILETQKDLRSGAYVYGNVYSEHYKNEPEKLAARLYMLGITDVYTSFLYSGKDDEEFFKLRKFVGECSKYKIKVYARGISSGKYFVSDKEIFNICNMISEYNKKVKKRERISGISADLEPHTMKAGRSIVPKELSWIWDGENGWGKGNGNDMGLKRTVEVMKLTKDALPKKLGLNEAINVGWQTPFNEEKSEWGSTHQFLEHCDYVIAMAYNREAEGIFRMGQKILSNASEYGYKKSVSIAVKTKPPRDSEDLYSIETSLEPAGWDNMLNSLEWVVKNAKEYSSFRGIDFFEFGSLEEMWKSE